MKNNTYIWIWVILLLLILALTWIFLKDNSNKVIPEDVVNIETSTDNNVDLTQWENSEWNTDINDEEKIDYTEDVNYWDESYKKDPVVIQNWKEVDSIDYEALQEINPLEQFKKWLDILWNPITKEQQKQWIAEYEAWLKRDEDLKQFIYKSNEKYTYSKENIININDWDISINKDYIVSNIDEKIKELMLEKENITDNYFLSNSSNFIKFSDELYEKLNLEKESQLEKILSNIVYYNYILQNEDYESLLQHLDLEGIIIWSNSGIDLPVDEIIWTINVWNYIFVVDNNYRIIDGVQSKEWKELDPNWKVLQAVWWKSIFEISDLYKKQ